MISKLKKEPYELNRDIPILYLVHLSITRVFMMLRGFFSMCKKKGIFFRGYNVKMLCSSKINLGKSVTIDHNCIVNGLSTNGIMLGDNTSIGKSCIIECTGNLRLIGKGLITGKNVGLGSNSFLGCAGGIVIGDDTIMGNYVSFHSENHNYENINNPIRLQGVNHQGIKIGNDCWIGAKVTILDGANLGNGCIVAAGAVLKAGNYNDYGIYGGVPAKLIKMRL